MLSIALLGLAHVTRLRWLAARYRERLATRNAERERIARDLHDTLLQSTEGLVLIFQAASNRLSTNDPGRGDIDRALVRASSLIAEGRDRVQELRTTGTEHVDLSEAIETLGKALALEHRVAFRLDVDGVLRQLPPRTGDEVYLILREAMSNAFQHAAAKSVDVLLRDSADGLRVTIRDDGRGLDLESLEAGRFAGRWGIRGMQERARHLGGILEIRSRVGGGTEIELIVPATPTSPRRHWVSRAFGLVARRAEDYPIE